MSDARGGQTGLKVLGKNLLKPPIFPQVAIKFILKDINCVCGCYKLQYVPVNSSSYHTPY